MFQLSFVYNIDVCILLVLNSSCLYAMLLFILDLCSKSQNLKFGQTFFHIYLKPNCSIMLLVGFGEISHSPLCDVHFLEISANAFGDEPKLISNVKQKSFS